MTTAATRNGWESMTEGTLFVAFELSEKTWKLGFTKGHGQKPRERTVTARQPERILDEIAQAKRRLSLPETAPVVSWGTHLRRDTVIPQWFQASKAAAASDGHAVHC